MLMKDIIKENYDHDLNAIAIMKLPDIQESAYDEFGIE